MLTYNQGVSGQKDLKNSGEVIGLSNFGAPFGVAIKFILEQQKHFWRTNIGILYSYSFYGQSYVKIHVSACSNKIHGETYRMKTTWKVL